ncbi:DNA-3-methyladenine glycosylase I [Pseudoalteromonas sp. NEC-BIFX-2020_015]|uniref:DNA-3-methyladenine glycosylase I n=1 Tax=Pseudoalteromonas sp. NEC-BIFX-2020_015 TaxID=2729544 RepID=UPI00146140C0|nr:DNA-3-methyladenine glycosylase I [Pseudoalteromonas sp. NEC-BIFX-2020_015]NMR27149.1 DNA-3-methyladenine glycosylase I [Pseudoalteromonas sp. NEC-BIFX-2020_015]
MNKINKCQWSLKTALEEAYHDEEWGVPIYSDNKLFELLSLELCQSGLSWHTILSKRSGYLIAFNQFDIEQVASFNDDKIEALVVDARIVRHRAKISAIINNAKCILTIQKEYNSLSNYLWRFVGNKPIVGNWASEEDIPASTELSTHISKELKKKGFKFLGTTTIYAFMQSVGLVNDHTIDCFRFNQC